MRSPKRLLSGVLAGLVVITGAGWAVGTRLRSPADEAALRRPPEPSPVTSPVVRRKLAGTVTVSGTLAYGSPLPVALAGVVGGGAEAQRVTRAPRPGTIREGSVLMEVNGRPVFALKGRVPMHLTMTPGTRGRDVEQLQAALRRLGVAVPATGVFDATTAAAVRRWYGRRGYTAQEPDLAARRELEALRQAVQTAEEDLLAARHALARATPRDSRRLLETASGGSAGSGRSAGDGASGQGPGAVPVLLNPGSAKGLRELAGDQVTVRITVGATEGEVLTVPVAAVVTSADGRPRVQVALPGDRTRDAPSGPAWPPTAASR
ncbi:peptidoglycan-binding protein [Planomonospora corallina]|uniref:Peptidoglycan-binding protein n=1 Tax=Planomonospora corallina TaxID=1806052 RepID=A0ABV8I2K9_9ACTN